MPLTHVCMWTKKGWKRVTAQEAGRIHPGGEVFHQKVVYLCAICVDNMFLLPMVLFVIVILNIVKKKRVKIAQNEHLVQLLAARFKLEHMNYQYELRLFRKIGLALKWVFWGFPKIF